MHNVFRQDSAARRQRIQASSCRYTC